MADTVPEVLFVCVHNAGRSQMAAALLHHHAAGAVRVASAGSAPADQVNPAVREVMAEIGIDLSHEFPKKLTTGAVHAADVVITMGCGDACPSSRASATSTGSSPTPPARVPRTFGRSATTSTPASGPCSPSSPTVPSLPPLLDEEGCAGRRLRTTPASTRPRTCAVVQARSTRSPCAR